MNGWEDSSTGKGGLEWKGPDNDTDADLKKETAVYQKRKENQAGQSADSSSQHGVGDAYFAHSCGDTGVEQTRGDNLTSKEASVFGAGVAAGDCVEVSSADDFTPTFR